MVHYIGTDKLMFRNFINVYQLEFGMFDPLFKIKKLDHLEGVIDNLFINKEILY